MVWSVTRVSELGGLLSLVIPGLLWGVMEIYTLEVTVWSGNEKFGKTTMKIYTLEVTSGLGMRSFE